MLIWIAMFDVLHIELAALNRADNILESYGWT